MNEDQIDISTPAEDTPNQEFDFPQQMDELEIKDTEDTSTPQRRKSSSFMNTSFENLV